MSHQHVQARNLPWLELAPKRCTVDYNWITSCLLHRKCSENGASYTLLSFERTVTQFCRRMQCSSTVYKLTHDTVHVFETNTAVYVTWWCPTDTYLWMASSLFSNTFFTLRMFLMNMEVNFKLHCITEEKGVVNESQQKGIWWMNIPWCNSTIEIYINALEHMHNLWWIWVSDAHLVKLSSTMSWIKMQVPIRTRNFFLLKNRRTGEKKS